MGGWTLRGLSSSVVCVCLCDGDDNDDDRGDDDQSIRCSVE